MPMLACRLTFKALQNVKFGGADSATTSTRSLPQIFNAGRIPLSAVARAWEDFPMLSSFRAGLGAAVAAACLAVACFAAAAATKPFTNADLTSSAVELEAQIKSDAGTPAKPVDQLKRDADAAFAKNDFRTGMAVLDQIVAVAPN